MTYSGYNWEVMTLFNKMKQEDENFYYALKTNERGQPDEIA